MSGGKNHPKDEGRGGAYAPSLLRAGSVLQQTGGPHIGQQFVKTGDQLTCVGDVVYRRGWRDPPLRASGAGRAGRTSRASRARGASRTGRAGRAGGTSRTGGAGRTGGASRTGRTGRTRGSILTVRACRTCCTGRTGGGSDLCTTAHSVPPQSAGTCSTPSKARRRGSAKPNARSMLPSWWT